VGGALAARALGAVLRRDAREHWRASLLLSLARALVPVLMHPAASSAAAAAAANAEVASHHGLALRAAGPWALDGCWAWKPLLRAPEQLRGALGVKGAAGLPGPVVGALMEEQAAWMTANPAGGADAAAAHLRAFAAEQGLLQ
jgi:hypothetical protein